MITAQFEFLNKILSNISPLFSYPLHTHLQRRFWCFLVVARLFAGLYSTYHRKISLHTSCLLVLHDQFIHQCYLKKSIFLNSLKISIVFGKQSCHLLMDAGLKLCFFRKRKYWTVIVLHVMHFFEFRIC